MTIFSTISVGYSFHPILIWIYSFSIFFPLRPSISYEAFSCGFLLIFFQLQKNSCYAKRSVQPIVVLYFLLIPVRCVYGNLSLARYLFVFSARRAIYIFFLDPSLELSSSKLSEFFRLPFVTVLRLWNNNTRTFLSPRLGTIKENYFVVADYGS